MGIIRKTLYTGILTGAGVLGYLGATTTIIAPLPSNDPLWKSWTYATYNVHRNPSMHDTCMKRIPLDKIKPELLQKDGDLVLQFCRGVWGGLGECDEALEAERRSIKNSPAADLSGLNFRLPTPPAIPRAQISRPCYGEPALDPGAIVHVEIRAGHAAVGSL